MEKVLKQKLGKRLKIIAGQVGGLEAMITREAYCVDIIHQSLAIQKALASLNQAMMRNHLATHVVHQMKTGQAAKAIEEILSICKLSEKH